MAQSQQGTTGAAPSQGTMAPATPGTGTGTTTAPGMNPPATGTPMGTTNNTGATGSDSRPPTTTTPAAGANSFTESQARRRIEEAGYTDVKELRKDDQGVWRGRAMRNGTEASVGLDFQGKVVTGDSAAR
ncbi:PepSY domain-containing protein [Roseomonas marmotae]|uniref:PepSY domain-containing protein n=2 Tax=Roseomonas marmotae TaxID=2768161 RepID=A0ABS3KA26_9PROT|nr:PepSY domain-containing protein [Roseomonas marmotae]QTI80966.1 PepSY domain-containing protein [Roseomonas marmotae]